MANFNENAERAFEQTVTQTRGAMEQYFNFIQGAFSSTPFGGTELADKMKNFTEANIAAAQKHVQRLGQAKNFQEALQIQAEYVQAQFQTFGEQTRSLAESFTSATTSAVKNPFRNY